MWLVKLRIDISIKKHYLLNLWIFVQCLFFIFIWKSYHTGTKHEGLFTPHREPECDGSFFCKWDIYCCLLYFPQNMSHVFCFLSFHHRSLLVLSDLCSSRFIHIEFCFLFIKWSLSFFCFVKRKRNGSDVSATLSRTMSAFPEGPPVLDYREPEPPPKGHKYQNSLKTLIPFRFGSRLEIHFFHYKWII